MIFYFLNFFFLMWLFYFRFVLYSIRILLIRNRHGNLIVNMSSFLHFKFLIKFFLLLLINLFIYFLLVSLIVTFFLIYLFYSLIVKYFFMSLFFDILLLIKIFFLLLFNFLATCSYCFISFSFILFLMRLSTCPHI